MNRVAPGTIPYSNVFHRSACLESMQRNRLKFFHNFAAFGHGAITGNSLNRDGHTFQSVDRHNRTLEFAKLIKGKGAYHFLVSTPWALFDRVSYLFSRAFQLLDTGIDKFIGPRWQSPENPLDADSPLDFGGRIVVGVISGGIALVRVALLVTSIALRGLFYLTSLFVEYALIKAGYQLLKLIAYLLVGGAGLTIAAVLALVAIPLWALKLCLWILSLNSISPAPPIDFETFGAVYRALERLLTRITNGADLRPKREESSDPGPQSLDRNVDQPTPRLPTDLGNYHEQFASSAPGPIPQEL